MKNDPAKEAIELVDGARQKDYGHPLDDFTKTAKIWSAILSKKLKMDIDPEEVALCMIGVKLSREANRPTFDNLVDICGYARTTQMVYEERARREGPIDYEELERQTYPRLKTDKDLHNLPGAKIEGGSLSEIGKFPTNDRHKHIPSEEDLKKEYDDEREADEFLEEINAEPSLFEDPSRSLKMTDKEIDAEVEKAMEGPSLFDNMGIDPPEEILSQSEVDTLLEEISGREFDDEDSVQEKKEVYDKYKETRETIEKIKEDLKPKDPYWEKRNKEDLKPKDPYWEKRNKDNTG